MTADEVMTAVTSIFPVTKEDILGPRRRRNETDARHAVAYIMNKHSRFSLTQIGEIINRPNHGTVVYAVKHAECLYDTDKHYRAMLDRVLAKLNLT